MEQSAGELESKRMKLTIRFAAAPVLFLAGALTVHAAGEPAIIKGADQFEFVYRVKLPEITGAARVWIPLAKTDSFQTVTVEELNIPMKWDKVQDRDYGNDICVVNAQPQDSGKTIELRYKRRAQGKSRLSGRRYRRRAVSAPGKTWCR